MGAGKIIEPAFYPYLTHFLFSHQKKHTLPKRVLRSFTPYFELSFWVMALVSLALMNPLAEAHFSLCLFKFLGFRFCPGCGLGHSITWLFHGNVQESFKAHSMGIFALPVILYRIFILAKSRWIFLTHIKQTNAINIQQQRDKPYPYESTL